MSDDKSDDAGWLLARERGQPGPAISEERVARYQRLEALVAELPATPVTPPAGWQERLRKKLDEASGEAAESAATTPLGERRAKHRRWVVPAAVAAAAAVIVILMWPPPQDVADPTIVVSVVPVDSKRASNRGELTEHAVGGQLIVESVVGTGGGELRLYNGDGAVQAICVLPSPVCHVESDGDRRTLRLKFLVDKAGVYRSVLFRPAPGKPSDGLDEDLARANDARIKVLLSRPEYFR